MKQTLFLTLVMAYTVIASVATSAYGSVLLKEPEPTPAQQAAAQRAMQNPATAAGATDDLDVDISIDPVDLLPANGTVVISTAGADDLDMNEFPPVGVSVVVQNQSITVTNHTVTIGNPTSTTSTSSSSDEGGGDEEGDEE